MANKIDVNATKMHYFDCRNAAGGREMGPLCGSLPRAARDLTGLIHSFRTQYQRTDSRTHRNGKNNIARRDKNLNFDA